MNIPRTVFLLPILLSGSALAADGLTIAVASNFQIAAREIAREFTQATNVPVRISSGSTGSLYAQIINGAPYDIFLAADAARPILLEESGTAVAGSRVTYATGALVLWSADSNLHGHGCLESLKSGSYRWLAIANPAIAPFGLAAKEYLQAAGLYDDAEDHIAYGENIAQALQFVVTGNATLGLIAKSQLKTGLPVTGSCSWEVPSSMHSPLHQQAVLLTGSENPEAARRFMSFLRAKNTATILENHGYTVPE